MKEYSLIGSSIPRVDATAKITGQAVYTDDVRIPRMLIGKILRSPYPHAKVLNIDTSKAEKLTGVKAVITSKDTGNRKLGVNHALREIWDLPALCIDKVRYIGDEVAAVAAIDEDTAIEALDLIDVEYEELPAVFDPLEAMEPGAPQIHEAFKNNISNEVVVESGDIEKAFKESYRVIEGRYFAHSHAHCCMEPHTSMANWDSDGRITLWTSTQAPFNLRNALAYVMDIPEDRVRVLSKYMGGGFGGKVELMPMDVCCTVLSKKTGCPVKITYTRKEEFEASRVTHPFVMDMKTGVTKDGIILAREIRNVMDGGAYGAGGPGNAGPFLSTLFLRLDYKVQNVKIHSIRVFTNKTVAGARRGYTAPQVRFGDCSHMDVVAEELGMDPVEFRLKNAITPGYTTPTGLEITSCGLHEAINKAAKSIGWKEKHGKLKKEDRGVGIALGGMVSGGAFSPNVTPMNYMSSAIIKLHTEGFATLYTGAQEIGQGSNTVLCMMAAEELGISMDKIRLVTGDTDISPYDAGSWSQRVTFQAGNAVKQAADDARDQIFEAVAKRLEANVNDLEAKDGRINVKGSPKKGMGFRDGIRVCLEENNGKEIVGRGNWRFDVDPQIMAELYQTGKGNYAPAYVFFACTADVTVDRKTGRIKLNKISFAHDIGRAINALTVRGQVEGGLHMGIGYSMFEELKMENGRLLYPSFRRYKIPTPFEMPEVDTILVETDENKAPFGAKSCGEGILVPLAPAIANAVYDAVGVRIKDLPITPEKILKALEEKEIS